MLCSATFQRKQGSIHDIAKSHIMIWISNRSSLELGDS